MGRYCLLTACASGLDRLQHGRENRPGAHQLERQVVNDGSIIRSMIPDVIGITRSGVHDFLQLTPQAPNQNSQSMNLPHHVVGFLSSSISDGSSVPDTRSISDARTNCPISILFARFSTHFGTFHQLPYDKGHHIYGDANVAGNEIRCGPLPLEEDRKAGNQRDDCWSETVLEPGRLKLT